MFQGIVSLPFETVELPREVRSDYFHLEVRFGTRRWENFDFVKAAEEIANDVPANCEFTWLTREHKAFGVGVFAVNRFSKTVLFPVFNVVFELGLDNTIW